MTRPSVVPSATLPKSSWPSVANESSEKPAAGSMSGRTQPEHRRDQHDDDHVGGHDEGQGERRERAGGARLRQDAERRRRAARDRERSPEERDARRARPPVSERANGMIGRAATKKSAVTSDEDEDALHERRPRQARARSCARSRGRARRRRRAR